MASSQFLDNPSDSSLLFRSLYDFGRIKSGKNSNHRLYLLDDFQGCCLPEYDIGMRIKEVFPTPEFTKKFNSIFLDSGANALLSFNEQRHDALRVRKS